MLVENHSHPWPTLQQLYFFTNGLSKIELINKLQPLLSHLRVMCLISLNDKEYLCYYKDKFDGGAKWLPSQAMIISWIGKFWSQYPTIVFFFFFLNETISHNTEKGHGVTRSQRRFIGLKQAPLSLMFSTYTFIRN